MSGSVPSLPHTSSWCAQRKYFLCYQPSCPVWSYCSYV